jgi:hypothetical protein
MKKTLIILCVLFAGLFTAQETQAQDYQTAVGARVGWGIAATGKHFISENNAIEAIANFRSFNLGVVKWSWISITGLYEIHNDLSSVTDGLKWYYGGGANVTLYSGDFDLGGLGSGTTFGVVGAVGLDYKFAGAPINLSVDWLPTFAFGAGSGFSASAGGLAVRYAF